MMANFLIHKDGAFNLYNTISDRAVFKHAIDLQMLKSWYLEEYGVRGMTELPGRLKRALRTGTSEHFSTLEDTVSCNRAGEGEATISCDEFVARFLTLPKRENES